jgi:hypothetical protein
VRLLVRAGGQQGQADAGGAGEQTRVGGEGVIGGKGGAEAGDALAGSAEAEPGGDLLRGGLPEDPVTGRLEDARENVGEPERSVAQAGVDDAALGRRPPQHAARELERGRFPGRLVHRVGGGQQRRGHAWVAVAPGAPGGTLVGGAAGNPAPEARVGPIEALRQEPSYGA